MQLAVHDSLRGDLFERIYEYSLGPLPGRGGEGGGAQRSARLTSRLDGGALGTARPTSGGQKAERVRAIDWEQPANNDFLLASQFSVTGAKGERQKDE